MKNMVRHLTTLFSSLAVAMAASPLAAEIQVSPQPPKLGPKVTSVFLSESFINEEIKAFVKTPLVKEMHLEMAPKSGELFLKGTLQIPIEELRAINLDPSLSAYKFQLTIKPEATPEGYLILEFPLSETFFYPASSKNPRRDRVVVPVQMLSVALASVRGYLAALSGDFSSFEKRAAKINALIHALNRSIATEKNVDAVEELKTEREKLKLQLAAVPIERKQLSALSKQFGGMLRFTGEKELNLNETFTARQNAIIIKLNLESLTPYLKGVALGGIHVVHDEHDGVGGENYFSIDVSATSASGNPNHQDAQAEDDEGLKIPPSAIIRIHQALFESQAVLAAQQKKMPSKVSDLKIDMQKDGLHVSGKYHSFFFAIPFDTIVDFDTADVTDAFDVSVRDIEVAGIDLEFMSGTILEMVKEKFDQSLKGICTFEYIGEKKDDSYALRVHMSPAQLIPALPGLHLVDVEVRDREFLLKVGKF